MRDVMKSSASLAVAVASAADCDYQKLVSIRNSVDVETNASICHAQTKLLLLLESDFTPETVGEYHPDFCASMACRALLEELKTAVPIECTIPYTTPKLALCADLLNPIETSCGLNVITPAPPSPTSTINKPATKTGAPTAVPSTSKAPTNASIANGTEPLATAPPPQSIVDPHPRNTTTIAAVVAACVLMAVIVVVVVVCWRRKQSRTATKDDASYVAMPDTTTTDGSHPACASHVSEYHALVPCRIPYDRLAFGNEIGHGGFGQVLRATYDGQDVAVKRLRCTDAPSLRRFVHEIQLTATLQHECIVQFIGATWEDPSSLCMVSEFMDGSDLRALLVEYTKNGHAHGHDDPKLRIAIHVAHAMTYLHSLDPPVVHRDLKSRNILLTTSLDAKLIDFGVSREQHDETMTAGIETSLWMAPEVMLGKRYNGKADVFSFGVILSELDTHELPYDHARDTGSNQRMTSMVLLKLISKGRLLPRFTDAAHPAIVALARDCLQLDPTLRPTARDVLHRIDQCLQIPVHPANTPSVYGRFQHG